MSAALSRLRRHFDDDLLARTGSHYELTALGQVLLDRSTTAYDLLERLFSSQASFDPTEEKREFRLMASDYAVAVFGAELARTVHESAPGIRLRFTQTPPTVVDDTGLLLSAVDGLLMPHGIINDYPVTDLYEDRWVFLVDQDHPDVGDRLTRENLALLPWVTYQRTYDAPAVRQLGMLGIEPNVEVSADSFLALPLLVSRHPADRAGPGAVRPAARTGHVGPGPSTALRGGAVERGLVVASGPHARRGPHLAPRDGGAGGRTHGVGARWPG